MKSTNPILATSVCDRYSNNLLKGIILLFLLFLLPNQNNTYTTLSAQEESQTISSINLDETQEEFIESKKEDNVNDKKESSKKKKKDIIELDDIFFINLSINLLTVIVLILAIYLPNNKTNGNIFSFILFNIIIFLLTYVLNEVKISMGAAFGLFAVFSMLRYRTQNLNTKDMTYLFIFIAIGLLSAIRLEFHELAVIHTIIIVTAFLMDKNFFMPRMVSKNIRYERIELIIPEKRTELIADLEKRTGIKIENISITNINFLKDTAKIKIYYYEK